MQLRLTDKLTIQLACQDKRAQEEWAFYFEGWLEPATSAVEPHLSLHLEVVPELNQPPQTPFFVDNRPEFADTFGQLFVYKSAANKFLLYFLHAALIEITAEADQLTAVGQITPQLLHSGRFEDITLTSLAPLLRRRGYFLLHAFAAARESEAALIVGPSFSGKTTTGLNLLTQGWQLLANDTVLLEQQGTVVYALPTPGAVTIRPQTFDLLPELRPYLGLSLDQTAAPIALTSTQVANGRWSPPSPVRALYFPQIVEPAVAESRIQPKLDAVALAHLMEESVDRWDRATLSDHTALLRRLSQQAACYQLLLGRDVGQLPTLFQ